MFFAKRKNLLIAQSRATHGSEMTKLIAFLRFVVATTVFIPFIAQAIPFAFSSTGSLTTPRYQHRATVLSNGKVLVSGGFNTNTGTLAGAELYDPATGMWAPTGTLATARR